jgi:phosphatidylglycerophosphate synthase
MKFKKEYLKTVKGTAATVFVYRYIGIHLAWKFRNTKITPNQLTVLSFLSGLLAALFFSAGSYGYLICGTLLYQICIIFDYSDGSLARFKNLTSNLGLWLEAILDPLREFFVIFGVCLGLYSHTGNPMIWVLGFILCGTNYMMDIQTLTFESFPFAEKGMRAFAPKNRLYEVGKQFISVRTTRYLAIIFFAIIDRMYMFLVFFSIYNMLVFVLIAFQLGRVVKSQDKLKLFVQAGLRDESNNDSSRNK